jgi:hypothetical protein
MARRWIVRFGVQRPGEIVQQREQAALQGVVGVQMGWIVFASSGSMTAWPHTISTPDRSAYELRITQSGGTIASASVVSNTPEGSARCTATSIAKPRACPASASAGGKSQVITSRSKRRFGIMAWAIVSVSSVQLFNIDTTVSGGRICWFNALRHSPIRAASSRTGTATITLLLFTGEACHKCFQPTEARGSSR